MKVVTLITKIVTGIISTLVIPAFLIWLSHSHIYPLFRGEFTQHLGSIEVSYITMAKFIEVSFPRFAWQPLWYLGYPMAVLYTPLVPVFEFVAHNLVGWSYSHAYRVLTASAYIGVLISLYFFAKTLFKNTAAGVVTSVSYGLLPSIIALFYEEVAKDSFSDMIDPRRFTILVRWGEGPHTASLVFLPLAALFLLLFLRKGRSWSLILGAFFTALVLLTNSVGAWGLAILCFCLVFGHLAENVAEWQVTLLKSVVFAIFSYALAAFWFNPLFLSTFFSEGGGALSYWRDRFPWGWLIIGAVLGAYFFLSQKILRRVAGLSSALLFFSIMFWLVNTYYASGLDHLELVPQVLRLNTEVDMGTSLLLGGILSGFGIVILKLVKKEIVAKSVLSGLALGFVLVMLPRHFALSETLPKNTVAAEEKGIDLTHTAEYEVATALDEVTEGDERVFVTGNYAFYLNYFTDVPQHRGALFQSQVHPWPGHMYYQITNGKDAEISLNWLKISNIKWLVYAGPREVFHDYKVPAEKFDATLEFYDELNGDRYYQVPLKDASLAKSVSREILQNPVPTNAIDEEPIAAYVEILERGKGLTTKTEANGVYHLLGDVREGEIVFMHEAFAPGWKASDAKGRNLEVRKDVLGFITVIPKEAGSQEITLQYQAPLKVWVGRLLTFVAVLGSIFLLIRVKTPLFSRLPPSQPTPEEEVV